MKNFEFIEHTADIKFKAFGKTLNGAFENSAAAVSNVISRGKKVKTGKRKKISVKGKDNEALLYNLIEEILYLLEVENFITAKAKVKVAGNGKELGLNAELFGDDVKNYKDLDHVKSPTYHEMYVKKTKSGWETQVVVDV